MYGILCRKSSDHLFHNSISYVLRLCKFAHLYIQNISGVSSSSSTSLFQLLDYQKSRPTPSLNMQEELNEHTHPLSADHHADQAQSATAPATIALYSKRTRTEEAPLAGGAAVWAEPCDCPVELALPSVEVWLEPWPFESDDDVLCCG